MILQYYVLLLLFINRPKSTPQNSSHQTKLFRSLYAFPSDQFSNQKLLKCFSICNACLCNNGSIKILFYCENWCHFIFYQFWPYLDSRKTQQFVQLTFMMPLLWCVCKAKIFVSSTQNVYLCIQMYSSISALLLILNLLTFF